MHKPVGADSISARYFGSIWNAPLRKRLTDKSKFEADKLRFIEQVEILKMARTKAND